MGGYSEKCLIDPSPSVACPVLSAPPPPPAGPPPAAGPARPLAARQLPPDALTWSKWVNAKWVHPCRSKIANHGESWSMLVKHAYCTCRQTHRDTHTHKCADTHASTQHWGVHTYQNIHDGPERTHLSKSAAASLSACCLASSAACSFVMAANRSCCCWACLQNKGPKQRRV